MPTPEPLREPASSPCQAPPSYWGEDAEGPCEAHSAALAGLLRGIVQEPQAEDRWLVLADFLEEHDDPRRPELLRLHRKLLATCCEPEQHPLRDGWHARIVELLAAGVKPCVPQRTVVLGPGMGMAFSFIPPGTCLVGTPLDVEGLQPSECPHWVTVASGFWLAVYPVTQRQWRAVMGRNPSRFKGDGRRPVEEISLADCQAFCERLRQKTGYRFRLPDHYAEWEYACRAGTTTAFYTGNGLGALKRAGWCSYDGQWGSAKRTKPVGLFEPNAWGLYDMHGNVPEWCGSLDGLADVDAIRSLCGGSWCWGPVDCRSAARHPVMVNACQDNAGCRLVLCPD
jgi:uncharacterized protein (TIGR02996 family)